MIIRGDRIRTKRTHITMYVPILEMGILFRILQVKSYFPHFSEIRRKWQLRQKICQITKYGQCNVHS